MVGRAAKKPAGERGPGLERGTPFHQFVVRGRKLPHAVDAVAGCRRRERHLLQVLRGRLIVVHRGHGPNAGTECGMTYVVLDKLAIQKDLAAIAKTRNVVLSILRHV